MADESDRGASRAECIDRNECEGFAKRLEQERHRFKSKHGVFPGLEWEVKHKRLFARWLAAKRQAEREFLQGHRPSPLTFAEWAREERAKDARAQVLADDFGTLDYDEMGRVGT